MSELAVVQTPQRREITQVIDPVPILDSARFEHMQRVANVLARSTMIPETLRTIGPKDKKEDLPFEQVLSNCFLVVNQAARWGFDPFAVISCCAVVHGRLSYEGKLVAAVLDAKLGINLEYHFIGDPATDAFRIYVSDKPFTAEIIKQLKPGLSLPGLRLWDGSVGEWKTTGAGTPWTQKNYRRMLIYRGNRDWTRIYESAIMLGVYTEDELLDLAEDARARRAAPIVSLSERLALARPNGDANGFSQEHVKQELGAPSTETEEQHEAGSEASAKTSPPVAAASAQEPDSSGSGATDQPHGVLQSPQPNSSPSAPSSPEVTEPRPASGQAHASSGAGASSQSPAQPSVEQKVESGEERQATASEHSAPQSGAGGLPDELVLRDDWKPAYAMALGRAQNIGHLTKRAAEFWKPLGGYEKIKPTKYYSEAESIYAAYRDHFGPAGAEARNVILRELGALD